jgi:hypothetical protein
MMNALELGSLLAKATIERANGAGVVFVAVFEASEYYKFYWTFRAKSPRSPRKSWKPIDYYGIYMGKHMSLDDMMKFVAISIKDTVRTKQRFPRGRREFDKFFHEIAEIYKRPVVIPPGAKFDLIRSKMARKLGRRL